MFNSNLVLVLHLKKVSLVAAQSACFFVGGVCWGSSLVLFVCLFVVCVCFWLVLFFLCLFLASVPVPVLALALLPPFFGGHCNASGYNCQRDIRVRHWLGAYFALTKRAQYQKQNTNTKHHKGLGLGVCYVLRA